MKFNFMIDFEIGLILAFFSLVGIYILRERKSVEFKYGIVIKRWKNIAKIDKFVKKNKKILRIIGIAGIIVAFIASFYGLYILFFLTLKKVPILGILVPTAGGVSLPKPFIGVDFLYWLPSIFILLFFHEGMHAIFARIAKIKIKDYGIILLLILPIGAFVNIDEEKVNKLKLEKKLAIYSAGSFGNIIISLITIGLLILSSHILDLFIEPIGLKYEVIENTSAQKYGLEGMITKIDGRDVKTNLQLAKVLSDKKPGDKIIIETNVSTFEIILQPHPENESKPFIGLKDIQSVFAYKNTREIVPPEILNPISTFLTLIHWISLINLSVGVANLLPLKPFDGGYIYEEILKKILGERLGESVTQILAILTLSLILINLNFGIQNFLRTIYG